MVNQFLPGHRLILSMGFLPVTIAGLVMLWRIPIDNTGPKYAGLIIVSIRIQ